jgi:hypothetical protein
MVIFLIRWSAVVTALVALTLPSSRAQAAGCQAGGALSLFPTGGTTCPTALHVGDQLDIALVITNTCSTVPGPGSPVAARLTGNPAIVYTLACVDTTCAVALPGTLAFVSVGANGCVSNAAGVTGCAVDGLDPNEVDVTVDAGGVALPAGLATTVATIRVEATADIPTDLLNPCGQLGTRADTDGNRIVTTDAQCDMTATGGAQGSTNLFLPEATATPTATATITPTPTITATPAPTATPTATATPGNEICRTAGFWAEHGGSEKGCSQNITQTVIDAAGPLAVCGESISTTGIDDAASALEAMCVRVRGEQRLQLARQLTAAALNCVVTDLEAAARRIPPMSARTPASPDCSTTATRSAPARRAGSPSACASTRSIASTTAGRPSGTDALPGGRAIATTRTSRAATCCPCRTAPAPTRARASAKRVRPEAPAPVAARVRTRVQ